ncbi:MAG TPA: TetR/AcrR family transcriptional regulator [Gemmatimonadaceae bacterium]|nr:TetR/AcrR family transcriptional regulator [Gemmatimonadaceae bacterium]
MGDRRAQIVDAATAVMTSRGFQQTSVDDVIREAGLCGKAHFYHYFKSKEELGYAVLRHQFESFADEGLAILRDPLVDPAERLDRFLDWIVESNNDCDCSVMGPCGGLAAEMARQHEGFRKQIDAVFEGWTAQLQALLWEARSRLGSDGEPERMARFMVATLEGAFFMSRVKQESTVLVGVATELKRYVTSQLRETPRASVADAERREGETR